MSHEVVQVSLRAGVTAAVVAVIVLPMLLGKTGVIARRELLSVFIRPLGYVFGAIFLLIVAWMFMQGFTPGAEASMVGLFREIVKALIVVVPILSMPLLSEEYARGTIEPMMTAPVTERQLVLGKFFAVFTFYVALLAATLVHMGLLMAYGQPELGQAWMGYMGLLLVGAAFLSVGLFFSSLTRDQLLAALLSAAVLAAVGILPDVLLPDATGLWHRVLTTVNVAGWFADLSKGILDLRSVVFFLSVTLFFLFVSVKVLESRRWR
ncbi:MAG: hypothetical protein BIFFINMI_01666 [Phycisphaerae bacterium]|nr:hypothetical protein [Phycisphaerae bacterium]